jgi:hypothetical protein
VLIYAYHIINIINKDVLYTHTHTHTHTHKQHSRNHQTSKEKIHEGQKQK